MSALSRPGKMIQFRRWIRTCDIEVKSASHGPQACRFTTSLRAVGTGKAAVYQSVNQHGCGLQPEDQEAPECKASCCCCCARILHGGLALAGSATRTSCERTEPAGCAEAVGRCSFGLRLLPTSGVHALPNRSEKEKGNILLGIVHTTNRFRTHFGASQTKTFITW